MIYSRGSEWNRWDLHIHTPETLKNDSFEGATIEEKWDKFYNDILEYIDDGKNPQKNIGKKLHLCTTTVASRQSLIFPE